MVVSYEDRIIKLQKEGMKPNLSRAREEKINALISKYQGLIVKRNQRKPRAPRKSYEQRIMELQEKIAKRTAKVQARKPEALKLSSSFVGPLLPTQTRRVSKEQRAMERQQKKEAKAMERQQKKEEKAYAKRMLKEAIANARAEAKNLTTIRQSVPSIIGRSALPFVNIRMNRIMSPQVREIMARYNN